MTNQTPPNRIRFWRQQRGWSLQRLAEAAGTTRAQIDKLERGSRRLTVDWMLRLAAPLGCDPRSLMDVAPPPLPQAGTKTVYPALQETIPIYRLGTIARQEGARRGAQPARRVPPPYFLAEAKNAYGLMIIRRDWTPLLRHGQIAFVNPQARCHKDGLTAILTQSGMLHIGLWQGSNRLHITFRTLSPKPRIIALPRTEIVATQPIIAVVDGI